MNKPNMLKGYIYVIASAIIFGCNPLMVNRIYDAGVNAMTLVMLRNALSIPVIAFFAYRQNRTLMIPRKSVPSVSALGIMGCALTQVILFSSYSYIASGTATVLHFVYPAVVVFSGLVFFKEKLTSGNLISILICILGISLFNTPGAKLDWRGSALALLSGVTYAVYIMQLDRFRYPQVSGFLLCFYTSAVSSIVLLFVCLGADLLTLPSTLYGWMLCFGYSVVVNFGAMYLFQQGTFYIGGQRASILSTLEPITGVIVGMLAFGEPVGLRTAVGSLLVICASILIAATDMESVKGK